MSTEPDVASRRQALRQRTSFAKLWALLRPYWFSEERWVGRGLLALLIGLNFGSVFLTVLIAGWNRQFFNALQVKDYPAFLSLLGRFGLLASAYIAAAVYALYFSQMLQIRTFCHPRRRKPSSEPKSQRGTRTGCCSTWRSAMGVGRRSWTLSEAVCSRRLSKD